MGHAFQHSLVDSLIRYHRMKGDNTLWQMGTDHAGIATQMIVMEQLEAEGIKPSDLGREKFLEKVWQWKEKSGGTISRQLRRLGASLHWETERFTLDEGLSRAVLEVFVRLYEEGLIYKGKRLVNWDPQLKSSISDLEVVSEEEKGHLWHVRYPLSSGLSSGLSNESSSGQSDRLVEGRDYLVVATTRPETMLGDTAVAVHPGDERYSSLVGREVELPLTGRRIPIIADHYVDPEFGSGCVKITPAHDFNDYEVGKRNNLPLINILNEDATLNESVPEKYQGLDRLVARKQVLADLEQLDLIEKIDDHLLAVPRGERSGVIIEPFLSDQWFVKIKSLAEPAIEVVENGEIEFIPKSYENMYLAWMRDIQDWCISRQQWWGHRVPAWYDDGGNIYVGRGEAEIREKHSLPDDLSLSQDEDVLDTWFSSALWTFSTLGWPDETPELETFHATDVMVTGHDIITFWVSRMIMMSLKFMHEVPFRKVYVTGLVTDANGQKMSKAKGNGLDPLDIIDGISLDELTAKRTTNLMQPRMAERIGKATAKEFPNGISAYGTDALRFTFYAMSTRSRTIRFDMNRVEGYRNFCNKLWNAANFVISNTSSENFDLGDEEVNLGCADEWILSELQKTIAAVHLAMETFRFDLAAKALYEFIWDEYCDWYIELSKPILYADDADAHKLAGTRRTLIRVLETTLRLAHPFIPFITEELWKPLKPAHHDKSIMIQLFPEVEERLLNEPVTEEINWLKQVITCTRNIRGEMDISFATQIPVLFHNGTEQDRTLFEKHHDLLTSLIKASELKWLSADTQAPPSAVHLMGEMQVMVPMKGLIDTDIELARLDKEIDKKRKDKDRTEGKINNPNFAAKAPQDVVEKEKTKLQEILSSLENLEEQKKKVSSL